MAGEALMSAQTAGCFGCYVLPWPEAGGSHGHVLLTTGIGIE